VNFAQERIEFSDALVELSQGLWEGPRRSDIYTPELLNMMASSQPDFHAPGGESQRQVEFRMVEFLNNVVLPRAKESKKKMWSMGIRSEPMADPSMQAYQHSDVYDDETRGNGMLMSPSPGRMHSNIQSHGKASGKSRLHIASSDQATTTVLDLGMKADMEEKVGPKLSSPYLVAVFSHGMAIKCLLRGILGSDPRMTHRFTIDNTSMTVLRHSTHTGWQLLRVNDTAHLRLL
jgi:broad specificity phosphatase PhoE